MGPCHGSHDDSGLCTAVWLWKARQKDKTEVALQETKKEDSDVSQHAGLRRESPEDSINPLFNITMDELPRYYFLQA